MTRTPSNRVGSLISERSPSARTAVLAALPGHTEALGDPRAKLSRAAVRWALTGLVVHHLTVARIAQGLGVSWKSR